MERLQLQEWKCEDCQTVWYTLREHEQNNCPTVGCVGVGTQLGIMECVPLGPEPLRISVLAKAHLVLAPIEKHRFKARAKMQKVSAYESGKDAALEAEHESVSPSDELRVFLVEIKGSTKKVEP